MLIIVMGLPGSGKSYFAKRLAGKLDMAYLNSDGVRLQMNMEGKYTPEHKSLVYGEMASRAKEVLSEGKNLVVDATFQRLTNRKDYTDLAKQFNHKAFCFYIWAKDTIIKERLSIPREESEADLKVHQQIKSNFDPISTDCFAIESTNENIEQMLTLALSRLA